MEGPVEIGWNPVTLNNSVLNFKMKFPILRACLLIHLNKKGPRNNIKENGNSTRNMPKTRLDNTKKMTFMIRRKGKLIGVSQGAKGE